jgi:predicted DNA-binding transcriptional regulator
MIEKSIKKLNRSEHVENCVIIPDYLITCKDLEDDDFRFLVYAVLLSRKGQLRISNFNKHLSWSDEKIQKCFSNLCKLGLLQFDE